jgi:hypothetical protein
MDLLQKPTAWNQQSPESPAAPPPRRFPGPGLLLAGAVFIVLILVLARAWPGGQPAPDTLPAATPNLPHQAFGPQRIVLRDYPDRAWLSYYQGHAAWLGLPVWGERPYGLAADCVGFTNYVVCHNLDQSVRGTLWEFLPALLGTQQLPAGTIAQLDAPLAPVVQNYLAGLEHAHQDWLYWLGRVISPAFCSEGSGECFQVFQRQVVRWPRGTEDPRQVRLSPLGLRARPS